MDQKRMFVARVVVALVFGIVIGIYIGRSMESDVEKGRQLTMDSYVKDFATYKAKLESHTASRPAAIIMMAIVSLGFFGMYEVLSIVLARLLVAVFGRSPREPDVKALE